MSNNTIKKYLLIDSINWTGRDKIVENITVRLLDAYVLRTYNEPVDVGLILTKKYIPQNGDNIYIEEHCKVPRFKLKEVCDKYKINITRDVTKSNIVFIAQDTIDKCFTRRSYNSVSIDCFKDIINALVFKNDTVKQFLLDNLNVCTGNMVAFTYGAKDIFDRIEIKPILIKHYPDPDDSSEYDSTLEENDYYNYYEPDKIDNIDLRTDTRLYSETQLIKYLNQSNVMDKESYDNVRSLFESEDNSNHVLGIEIMANCDYRKSAPYLLLLFEEYHRTIHNTSAKNHVNFKSFTRFFKLDAYGRYTLNQILSTLRDTKLATIENIEIVLNGKKNELLGSEVEDEFEVRNIYPNKEFKTIIVNSIIDNCEDNNVSYSKEDIVSYVNNYSVKINPNDPE